jgi:exopolysaccharide production protein ExoZ
MYRSVQGCRALAAVLVVLHHLGAAMASPKYFGASSFALPFLFGDSGVEFFFVLSGFIITWVHIDDIGNPSVLLQYVRKRMLRIYPVYWIVFSGVYLIALASTALRSSVPHDWPTLLRSLMLVPQDTRVIGGTGAPVLIVAWSLQYEICFYLFFAAAIANRILGALVAIALLANMGACIGDTCSFPRSFFSSNLVLLFGLGIAVAYTCKSSLKLERPGIIALLAALAFVSFGRLETALGHEAFAVDRRLVYGFFSAILILGLVRAEDAAHLRVTQRWIPLLGDASYSLYLIHFPLISVLCKVMVAAGLAGVAGAAIAYPLILLACIFTALMFHVALEKPLLRAMSSHRARVALAPG